MAPYSAMWWISGTLLALAIAGESAVRNRRRNRLQAMLKPDRLERLDAFLERELELIDSLVIMRLVAFTVLIVGTGLGGDGASTELPDVASRLGALLGVVIVGFYGTIREAVRRMPERALLLLVPFLRVTDFVLSPVRWAMSRLGAGLAPTTRPSSGTTSSTRSARAKRTACCARTKRPSSTT
jgi:CBS domain containing-hemolysin-like protein